MVRPFRQQEKLARGAKDEEHAMSHKLNAGIAVIGIDIGKNSFHVVVGRSKEQRTLLLPPQSEGHDRSALLTRALAENRSS
jgi:hypothetical protein